MTKRSVPGMFAQVNRLGATRGYEVSPDGTQGIPHEETPRVGAALRFVNPTITEQWTRWRAHSEG
jgi:hypothetical protein